MMSVVHPKRRLLITLFSLCAVILGVSCAVQEQPDPLMQRSLLLERENRQEELLAVYRDILRREPENREIREKLHRLQQMLARSFNDQVRQAMKERRLQSALKLVERHRSLLAENPPSPQIERELRESLIRLESLKYQAHLALQDGDYIEARDLLARVINANREDAEARISMDRVVREGKQQYLEAARSYERRGDWTAALQAYELTMNLSPDPGTREKLEKSRKATEALSKCKDAAELLDKGEPEEALERMKEAISRFTPAKIPFCDAVQRRVNTAMALKHYQRGIQHEAREEWEKAFEEFRAVEVLKPGDPAAREHLEQVRSELEKRLYSRILYFIERGQFLDARRVSHRLEEVSPAGGETLDLAARALTLWADELYRKGLYYASHGFHANAWLHFRSVAEQIPEYLDSHAQVTEQWQKVRGRVRARMTFIPFFSEVPWPGRLKGWNNKLFEALKSRAPAALELVVTEAGAPPRGLEELLELIDGISGGMAVCGWLESLNVRHSVSTSFEPMEYTIKEKALNPRYFQLQEERRLLYERFQAVLLAEGPRSESAAELKQKIDQLEGELEGISPVMEVMSPGKADKKIQTHKLIGTAVAAFRVFDVRTLKEVWSRDVREEFTVSDEAIDPIFEAGFPGKSLDLPTEGEFKQRLLDRVIPRLQKEMDSYVQNYALNMYQRAEDKLRGGELEEALELYADFLAMGSAEDTAQLQRAREMLERAREAIGRMKTLESIASSSSEAE